MNKDDLLDRFLALPDISKRIVFGKTYGMMAAKHNGEFFRELYQQIVEEEARNYLVSIYEQREGKKK